MSTRFTCSKCGATIIEHSIKPGEESECPRCGHKNIVPISGVDSGTTELSQLGGGVYVEPIGFRPNLANPLTRLLAQIINSVIVLIVLIPNFLLVGTEPTDMSPVVFWLPILALIAVQIYFLTVDGQSIGKKVLGLRIVMKDTGVNGGFVPNVLLRAIVNDIVCIVPVYGLIDILFIIRGDRRCIHDLIAGTVVVEPVKVPPVDQF